MAFFTLSPPVCRSFCSSIPYCAIFFHLIINKNLAVSLRTCVHTPRQRCTSSRYARTQRLPQCRHIVGDQVRTKRTWLCKTKGRIPSPWWYPAFACLPFRVVLPQNLLQTKNVPEPFLVKNRVRVRTVWWARQDLNPRPSGYENVANFEIPFFWMNCYFILRPQFGQIRLLAPIAPIDFVFLIVFNVFRDRID